ncbi:helicase associated domain-containing protein [Streptomyces sp. CB01635]|uniref:helicase associated domain-containing protein n=1 Tax=Streptomyces sp. CB01635 TaxID=2020326 RepID=UPI002697034B|nr:helicase associated domain-containing protein [Streptomyces sp. CB01635]
MVWSMAGERFLENLAAARVYYEEHWTLRAPRTATALDKPVGQWLSNLRRPGALDGHPEWEAALSAIAPDWNPQWPPDWQRHYAAVREMLRDEASLTELQPGVTVHGMNIGRWLARQRKPEVWTALTDGQRERLEAIGITPQAPERKPDTTMPAKPSKTASGAFERGIRPGSHKARTGSVTPTGACRGSAGRVGGEARSRDHEPEGPPRKADRGQAEGSGRPRTGLGTIDASEHAKGLFGAWPSHCASVEIPAALGRPSPYPVGTRGSILPR